jgi:hypothetical protein
MSTMSRETLWARLRQASLVDGELPDPGEARVPWFVRVMMGIAGWIGALFLLGFVGVGFAFVMKESWAAIVVGAGACFAATTIFRAAPKSDFMAQFGLAVSLAGQALLLFGFAQWLPRHGANGLALVIALQEAALFVLIPNYLHRVLCAWGGVLALMWLLVDAGFYALAPAAVTAAFIWVWLSEFDFGRQGPLLRAGGYGLALAAVQTAVMHGGLWGIWMATLGRRHADSWIGIYWLGHIASALVLLWAVLKLLRREGLALDSGQGRVALAGAVILGAASFKAPGVAPAVAILIVGYANGNRVLAGLGIFALIGYLSHFYYSLHATLLVKSALLAATGVALLLARLAMRRWWPGQTEASHA